MSRWGRRAAAIAGLALALAGAAAAEPMRITFRGIVALNNPYVGLPAVGTPVVGSFTIDPAITTGEGPNCTGIPYCWSGPSTAWDFNGVTVAVPSSNPQVVPALYAIRILITNSSPGAGEDRYDVVLTGISATGSVQLALLDNSGTAFESLPQPLLPKLQRFSQAAFAYLPGCPGGNNGFGCISTPYYYGVPTSLAGWDSADLVDLTLSAGVLLPPFTPGATSYVAAVPSGVAGVTVTPTAADPTATIKVNGVAVPSGAPSGIVPLASGSSAVTVQVISHDGSTTKTYNVTVNRIGGGGPAAPALSGVVSRKAHGVAGTFDLPLTLDATNPTTEPRAPPGSAHTLVFTFNKAIASAVAHVTAGTATAGATVVNGATVSVALSGVADRQYVTVSLTNVASTDGGTGGSAAVRVGFLMGDVSGDRAVSLSDLLQANAVLAQPVSTSNYLRDVNASGTLTVSDLLAVGANLAQALPAP